MQKRSQLPGCVEEYETRSLLKGDVPIFYQSSKNKYIVSGEGDTLDIEVNDQARQVFLARLSHSEEGINQFFDRLMDKFAVGQSLPCR